MTKTSGPSASYVKGWLTKAIRASSLPPKECDRLRGASTYWLRHTFGTRAIAREVPLDVIQTQMGHASIQTTTEIYGRAPSGGALMSWPRLLGERRSALGRGGRTRATGQADSRLGKRHRPALGPGAGRCRRTALGASAYALAASDVALMACRGAKYHHDGAAAFCNLFLSEDRGLDLHFPATGQRIRCAGGLR